MMKKGNYGKRRIVYTRLFVSNGQSVGDTIMLDNMQDFPKLSK